MRIYHSFSSIQIYYLFCQIPKYSAFSANKKPFFLSHSPSPIPSKHMKKWESHKNVLHRYEVTTMLRAQYEGN